VPASIHREKSAIRSAGQTPSQASSRPPAALKWLGVGANVVVGREVEGKRHRLDVLRPEQRPDVCLERGRLFDGHEAGRISASLACNRPYRAQKTFSC
jgi:hypothetical protein